MARSRSSRREAPPRAPPLPGQPDGGGASARPQTPLGHVTIGALSGRAVRVAFYEGDMVKTLIMAGIIAMRPPQRFGAVLLRGGARLRPSDLIEGAVQDGDVLSLVFIRMDR